MSNDLHLLIVEADFYRDISDALLDGAKEVLDAAGASYEIVQVPGCLEIPAAIRFAIKSMEFMGGRRRFDAYVALGCVIRGETSHYDTVSEESARALMDISTEYCIAVGNGIITCENDEQAWARARKTEKNKGGGAADAALKMLKLKEKFGMFPR
ncbi:6,7-dimethyl-8-ribityllumazine synthase [Sneathiella sp. CAU 1612]|uniref:6,7-dimethyl-8-ribityllumazine synthase n=1 Tax=Sneathiella sedimenti TaxID=2816034 RepID=A0ABS3F7D0_9PROT|nr:6,7-dimethyl-8-ribityllumazine synthase [Sneathiella sedimenti]MBO0334424.1 6,7-dimethyl-8-ribityllumazine synthase [Sneathiella sedimenti]